MNLKLVVASMSLLGLVCCPVYAATTAKAKHHKAKYHHHHVTEHQEMMPVRDYKDMGVPEVCTIKHSTMIMESMTQNMGRALPNPCNPGWFNRIHMSGGINIDAGKFGNRNGNIQGENYQRLSLNDAYLNVGADVNEWVKGFASLSYNNPTTNANPGAFNALGAAEYSAAYSNNINGGSNNVIQLEQAFATVANPDVTPFFLQIGKQFQDFSRYEIHPITRSMTQVMSEVLATSIKVGFIVNGFHGSVYAFDDPINKVGTSAPPTNAGAALGYDAPGDYFGWDIGAAYLYNLIGANDVAYSVVNFNTFAVTAADGAYRKHVSGLALYADMNTGPFVLGLRYTQALNNFNVLDLPRNGAADVVGQTITGGSIIPGATGAKPWAAGIQGAYGFEGWNFAHNVYLGYQLSRQAGGLNLPKNRYLVGYNVDLFGKMTNVGVEWDHDNDYSFGTGGRGNTTNLVSIRGSFYFS